MLLKVDKTTNSTLILYDLDLELEPADVSLALREIGNMGEKLEKLLKSDEITYYYYSYKLTISWHILPWPKLKLHES